MAFIYIPLSLFFFLLFLSSLLPSSFSCSSNSDCGAGFYCGNCPVSGKNQKFCIRAQAIEPHSIVKGLPFNKYTWLVTHNSFSNVNEPSNTGVQRITFYNQEDSVANQLKNGIRGLMLDMYDFDDDVWLCHSFQGQCYNFTAFEPALNTLKEVESFLAENPTEIITIFIEDYVHTPMGLSSLFTKADLMKYFFPVSEMPQNGKDWPTVTEMAAKNQRFIVFTSVQSKELSEGIAYQWRYLLENEAGDPGFSPGSCPNRKESQPLNSGFASLFMQNYFPTLPVQNEVCKENSAQQLAQMVQSCYNAAGNRMPNFIAVNFYMRSDGGGVFDVQDRINGLSLCGCSTIAACQAGQPMGVCKNTAPANQTPTQNGNVYSGTLQFTFPNSSFSLQNVLNIFSIVIYAVFVILFSFL